jgi:hypothetical protein
MAFSRVGEALSEVVAAGLARRSGIRHHLLRFYAAGFTGSTFRFVWC